MQLCALLLCCVRIARFSRTECVQLFLTDKLHTYCDKVHNLSLNFISREKYLNLNVKILILWKKEEEEAIDRWHDLYSLQI